MDYDINFLCFGYYRSYSLLLMCCFYIGMALDQESKLKPQCELVEEKSAQCRNKHVLSITGACTKSGYALYTIQVAGRWIRLDQGKGIDCKGEISGQRMKENCAEGAPINGQLTTFVKLPKSRGRLTSF